MTQGSLGLALLLLDGADGALNDLDKGRPVSVHLQGLKDFAEALGELSGVEMFGDRTYPQGPTNDAVEARRQRRPGGPTPQQGHEVVHEGADAGEVEAGLGDLAGLEATGGAQTRQTNLSVRRDAHVAQRDITVGQPGVVGDGVQGGNTRGEVAQQQETLVEGEVDPTVLHRR